MVRSALACALALATSLILAGTAGAAFLTPEYETTVTGSGENAIGQPLGVAVDEASGDFYVADLGNHRIEKFDADGNFLLKFGSFANPSSVTVDNSDGPSKGDVYVTEGPLNGGNGTVQKFDGTGQPVVSFGTGGSLAIKALRKVTVSPFDGSLWSIDGVAGESPGATDGGHVISYTETGVQKFRVETRQDAGGEGTMAVDSKDRLWFTDHQATPQINDISRYEETAFHSLGRVTPATATHFAVNAVNSDVLMVVNESEVMVFEGSCDPTKGFCVPKETFGGGQLSEPKGLAIDGSTGSVYVAVSGGVAVFRAKVVPDVIAKPASVGHSDAVLAAHLDPLGEGNITGCAVEYGPGTDYGTTVPCDQQMPLGAAADVTVHLAGLTTETPYHYRFRATNANGTSNGRDRVVTPHWVNGLETGDATEIGPGAATLQGELDPEGEPTHYYFEWGINKNYGHRTPELPGSQIAASDLTQVEASLAGQLTSVTTYHYRIVANNALGTSFGFDREFTTPLGTAPQIGGVSGAATGPTTAMLQLEVNPNFGDTAYKFQYGLDSGYGSSTVVSPSIANDGNFHTASVEITGLSPATTYHYRAIVFNFVERVLSPDLTFTTPPVSSGGAGGGAAPVPAPPAEGGPEVKKPLECKKGQVRKNGRCVKKKPRRHKRKGGSRR